MVCWTQAPLRGLDCANRLDIFQKGLQAKPQKGLQAKPRMSLYFLDCGKQSFLKFLLQGRL